MFATDTQTGVMAYSCCWTPQQAEQGAQTTIGFLGKKEDMSRCFTSSVAPSTEGEWAVALPGLRHQMSSLVPALPQEPIQF